MPLPAFLPRRLLLLGAFVLALPAAGAPAAQWVVDESASQVGFEYLRNGNPAPGFFRSFHGEGTLDPARPDTAQLTLVIDSASIDLHDRLASAFATSAEWFDSRNYPEVTYRLTRLTPLGGTAYRAEGFLTLRGRTRAIVSEIDLSVGRDSATAKGTLEIDRRPYLLGVGPSAAFVEIGPEVEVRFDLSAHPVR